MISNKRITINIQKEQELLDTILQYFEQNLSTDIFPLRWAIIDVHKKTLIIEASLLNLSKINFD